MGEEEEVRQLLSIFKLNCFSLAHSVGDTEVEDDIIESLQKIEDRIIELVAHN